MPVRVIYDDSRNAEAVGKQACVQPCGHHQIVAWVDVMQILIKRREQHRDVMPFQQIDEVEVLAFMMRHHLDLVVLFQAQEHLDAKFVHRHGAAVVDDAMLVRKL